LPKIFGRKIFCLLRCEKITPPKFRDNPQIKGERRNEKKEKKAISREERRYNQPVSCHNVRGMNIPKEKFSTRRQLTL